MNKHYNEIYQEYEITLRKVQKLSFILGGRIVSSEKSYASVFLSRIAVTATSIYKIYPNENYQHYDFQSIASLARNIMECYILLLYFSVEKIDQEEWYLRWNIMNLKDCVSRIKLFENMKNLNPEDIELENHINEFHEQKFELIGRIKENRYFQQFTSKKRKKF